MNINLNLTKAQAELLHEVVEMDIIRVESHDMDNKHMILQRLIQFRLNFMMHWK